MDGVEAFFLIRNGVQWGNGGAGLDYFGGFFGAGVVVYYYAVVCGEGFDAGGGVSGVMCRDGEGERVCFVCRHSAGPQAQDTLSANIIASIIGTYQTYQAAPRPAEEAVTRATLATDMMGVGKKSERSGWLFQGADLLIQLRAGAFIRCDLGFSGRRSYRSQWK